MLRCPNCGMDVSPALRVCGACQTKLDGERGAIPAGVASSTSALGSRATVAKVGIAFLLLWPFVSLAIGISSLGIFAVWFLAAILLGVLGKGGLAVAEKSKTISVPVFGTLTARTWKAGQWNLWEGTQQTPTAGEPLEVLVLGKDDGPSSGQASLLSTLLRELPRFRALAIEALGKSDRSEWPAAALEATPEVAAIELDDDEETAEGCFTVRLAAIGDPDGSYYVDFRGNSIEAAYRVG